MDTQDVQIESKSSARFSAGAVLVVCAYGLLLVIPVIIAMMVVSVLQFGVWTFLIPMAAIATATYFLPFGFGNAYVSRLVHSVGKNPGGFIVQLTFSPRLRS